MAGFASREALSQGATRIFSRKSSPPNSLFLEDFRPPVRPLGICKVELGETLARKMLPASTRHEEIRGERTMRLSLGFEQKQVQKQILAPRMIQSMEILQLPIQELEARIDQELNENPILERQEVDPALPEESYERESPDAPTDSEKELVVDEKANNVDDFERLLDLNREVPDYFDERPRMSSGRIEEMSMRRHDTLANLVTRPTTLQESLQLQLRELEVPAPVNEIALRIISSLDANGYLLVNLEDLLPADFDSAQQEYARRALDVVQSLEPVGVGARSLQECLLLQLTPDMELYTELKTLITHHLDDLKDNRLPQIRKKTGYSFDKIHETWDALRKLNPKPARRFKTSLSRR